MGCAGCGSCAGLWILCWVVLGCDPEVGWAVGPVLGCESCVGLCWLWLLCWAGLWVPCWAVGPLLSCGSCAGLGCESCVALWVLC